MNEKPFNYESIPTPTPGTPPTAAWVTREALKVLENNLALTNSIVWHPGPPSTRWQRTKWAMSDYFSNLWDAICGRRCDY